MGKPAQQAPPLGQEPKKKKKKEALRPQPAWLFPPEEENPVLNPKVKSAEQIEEETKARLSAIDYLKHRSVSAPMKSAPPGELMQLIGAFLTSYGFNSTSRVFTSEREARRKIADYKDEIGKKLDKSMPNLLQIYQAWQHEWQLKHGTDVADETSSEEEDEDESEPEPAVKSKSKKATANGKKRKGASSDSDSESSSDSDSDSDDDDDDSDDSEAPAKKRKVTETKSKPVKDSSKPKPKQVNDVKPGKKAATASSDSSSSDSDSSEGESSEDSEVAKLTKASKPGRKAQVVPAHQNAQESVAATAIADPSDDPSSDSDSSSSDSESDSGSKAVAKPATKAENGTANGTNTRGESKTPTDSSHTLNGDSVMTPATSKRNSKKNSKKTADSSSDSDDSSDSDSSATDSSDDVEKKAAVKTGGVQKRKRSKSPVSAQATPVSATNSKAQKKNNVPFSRISKDTAVDPRLASNAYVPYDYAQRAHEDLIVTRGKGFTKEKNKKKRGSYRGGMIDVSGGKGIKFDD